MDVPGSLPDFSPPDGIPHLPSLSAWDIARTPDGGYRVQTPYASRLRAIAVNAFMGTAVLVATDYFRKPIGPALLLILLASLAAVLFPLYAALSYREEWRVGPGRLEVRRGCLGLLRRREHRSGTFAIVARKPPTRIWLAALNSLLGAGLMVAGAILLGPLTASHPRHPASNLPLFILALALVVYGALTFVWPFLKWLHERAEHAGRRPQLALRTDGRETVLIPSEFRMEPPALEAFAAWLARETGWTVEPAP